MPNNSPFSTLHSPFKSKQFHANPQHISRAGEYVSSTPNQKTTQETRKTTKENPTTTQETTNETTNETTKETTNETTKEKILALLKSQPSITHRRLAEVLGISRHGVNFHLKNLKAAGIILHVGARKTGRWEVLIDANKTPE